MVEYLNYELESFDVDVNKVLWPYPPKTIKRLSDDPWQCRSRGPISQVLAGSPLSQDYISKPLSHPTLNLFSPIYERYIPNRYVC